MKLELIRNDYEFTELINGVICDCVERLQDAQYNIDDIVQIANDLLDYDFRNGSYYCSSNMALDDIYNNFYAIADLVNECENEGYKFTSIFESVEIFHLEILYHGAVERLACEDVSDFLEEHADEYNYITFDSEIINEFKDLFIRG